jgi:hypothetical protein
MRLRVWPYVGGCMAIVLAVQIADADVSCEADIARLCKDVPMGSGRIQACLKEHETEVSEACRTKIDELATEAQVLAVVCRWDMGLFCSGVAPGGGRLLACLQQNASGLSGACERQLRDTKQP